MFKRIIKIIWIVAVLPLIVFSQEVESDNTEKVLLPQRMITLENNIVVTNLVKDSLLIGTDFGEVLEWKWGEQSPKLLIKLPDIESFYSESYAPKVYSVDQWGEKILIHSEGDYGTKKLFLLANGKLEALPNTESLNIKKAAFVNEERIFLGLTSNEIVLYDLTSGQILYRKQLSEASFSDFALDNGNYVVTCESGILYFGAIKDGSVLGELEGENKDNVYQVKTARVGEMMTFITAGQDRNVGLYQLDLPTNQTTSYGIKADFLVYSVGINGDSTLGAYMQNEQSEIIVFEIASKKKIARLEGHKSLLNNIIFYHQTQIISSEDGKNILIWNLKE